MPEIKLYLSKKNVSFDFIANSYKIKKSGV